MSRAVTGADVRTLLLLGLVLLFLAHCASGGDPARESADTTGPSPEPAEPSPFDGARELTSQRRHDEAAAEYARLAEGFAKDGDAHNRWKATLEQARALYRTTRKQEAMELILRVAELADGQSDRELQTAYYHAAFLHEAGRLDEALEAARRAVEWGEKTDDPQLMFRGLGMLATVYSLMGRYAESMAINERLLDQFRRVTPHPPSVARTLNELAIDYKHFGRFDEARKAYEEAATFFRREGPERWLRIVLYNLSNVHSALGEVDRSLELKLEVLEMHEGASDPYGLGMTLDSIGTTYAGAGNLAAAREYLDRGIAVARESERPYVLIGALIDKARVEREGAEPARAKQRLLEAVSLADGSGYGFEAADARAELALTEIDLGEPERALRWADEAVERAAATEDPNILLQTRNARARALQALGRRTEAAGDYERAVALLESWRGRLAMGDLRMGLVEPRTYVYEGAIDNLMALERVEDAFAVAERARAQLLLELLASQRGAHLAEPGPEALIRRLMETYVAAAGTRSDRLREQFDAEIDALIAELEAAEKDARSRDPVTAASLYPRAISAARARELLSSSDRALIGYFWGEREVYGWWIGTDGVRGVRLGRSDELRPTIDFLRSAIRRPDTGIDWRAASRRAYERLVAPLAPGPVAELLIVPDGPLNLLPLEILIPDAGDSPWGIGRRIVYGPSASVLAALAHDRQHRSFDRAMLALGAPRIDAPSEDDVYRQGTELTPLRHAANEARYIAGLYRSQGATLLLGANATAQRWIDAEPGRYRYLHFATHAIVSDRRPELTHLVLTGGALDLATIRRQPMRAELVTVSACESAIGKRVRGEGIVGLPHAFLASGARGAVVALWRVEDRSAAEFMREFYSQLHGGQSAAEALRGLRASWFAASGGREHPSRWAPFIQIGGI